ncbi:MAG: bifunctional nuclease family protein [Muribaculaceae bacterium]
MDDRVRLRILGISYSQLQSGAYALLLAEEDGPHKIPVVIGASEAQSIAIRIEGIVPPRPLTHDLFVSFAQAFGVKLREVFIYKFEDGIFYSELTFSDGERTVVLDARTSDAIAIAIRAHVPIVTTAAIVRETGFILDDEPDDGNSGVSAASNANEDLRQAAYFAEPKLENYAVEELERTLEQLIEDENYEEAARVSEILKKKKERRDNPGAADDRETQL